MSLTDRDGYHIFKGEIAKQVSTEESGATYGNLGEYCEILRTKRTRAFVHFLNEAHPRWINSKALRLTDRKPASTEEEA